MTDAEVSRHVTAAGELWTRRSGRVWTLDLSMLTDAGVTLARPDPADARRDAAERELLAVRQPVVDPVARPPSETSPKASPPTASAPTRGGEQRWSAERRGWFREMVGRA